MKFSIAPKDFSQALKRLLPHGSRKLGLRADPLVLLRAEGQTLDLTGQFENVWSIPASVTTQGSCIVDIKSLILRLKLYDQKEPLAFVLEPEGLKFGTTRLKRHAPW